ncbi:MAG: protein kinase, partial [Cyanobacteria bacterium J06633_2]
MSNHNVNQPLRPSISGYILTEELYSGRRTSVYRALAAPETQTSPVVIKFLRGESKAAGRPSAHPSFNELVRFRNQFIIAQKLASPGIVTPLTLELWNHSYALVMEDVKGLGLWNYLQTHGHLSITQVIEIAIQLADTLHHLSQHRVLHKDINPANILIQPDTHQIWLTD